MFYFACSHGSSNVRDVLYSHTFSIILFFGPVSVYVLPLYGE